jgi:hypothetical protein
MNLTPKTRWILSMIALALSGAQAFFQIPVALKGLLSMALQIFGLMGIKPEEFKAQTARFLRRLRALLPGKG